MNNNFLKLEKIINIYFKDKKILFKSLTHKSNDPINNNEKLEFLGDRVLGLVISKKLLEIYPDESEGILDKKLASLVNKKTCLLIAKKIDLNKFANVGNAKRKNIKIQDKVLSDCCEALIGAIYLDLGFACAENFILKQWDDKITKSSITPVDPKTKLQEFSLKKFKKLPLYKIINNSGPRHNPTFKVSVKITDTKFFEGSGSSIKQAQQEAARMLNKYLGI
jgi:ribonuclease-3